ncbi:Uma2 family endonuclease [Streptomyces sp. NBC_01471]
MFSTPATRRPSCLPQQSSAPVTASRRPCSKRPTPPWSSLEVTSSNYNQDLRAKVSVYAEADIPVYVIVNRKHQRVHVLTEPVGSDYASHQIFAAGQQAPLPASIGGDVTLDVTSVLQAGAPVRAKD